MFGQLVQVHPHHRAFINLRLTIAGGADKRVPGTVGGGTFWDPGCERDGMTSADVTREVVKCQLQTSRRNFAGPG
jgi:hypothetical protein